MTNEEKRTKLIDMCTECEDCCSCPLVYRDEDCDFLDHDDNTIDKLYSVAFPTGTEKPHIKDSGERRHFDTGAVRDIQEGKGRCDLMPLGIIGSLYYKHFGDGTEKVFFRLADFQDTGDSAHLLDALSEFINISNFSAWSHMFLEVAKHFEEGAKKYGENNWQKGIPVHCYIDSAVRHLLKWLREDDDEPHDRAFCWNILCCLWTCEHKPELIDLPFVQNNKESEG